jgi:hypothetical protein
VPQLRAVAVRHERLALAGLIRPDHRAGGSSCPDGLRLCEHLDHPDGEVVFRHACKMGLEGIVSKRRDSPYRSGRSPDWLKLKNLASVAAAREAEEDWYN